MFHEKETLHLTDQELTVFGFSYSEDEESKTMEVANGKFSSGFLAEIRGFLAIMILISQ